MSPVTIDIDPSFATIRFWSSPDKNGMELAEVELVFNSDEPEYNTLKNFVESIQSE